MSNDSGRLGVARGWLRTIRDYADAASRTASTQADRDRFAELHGDAAQALSETAALPGEKP